jgi:hypothetical protein
MSDTPCQLCNKSGDDQDDCLYCLTVAAALVLGSRIPNPPELQFETMIGKSEGSDKWRGFLILTYADGRQTVYATVDEFDTPEECRPACDEMHDNFARYCEHTGATITTPAGHGFNAN